MTLRRALILAAAFAMLHACAVSAVAESGPTTRPRGRAAAATRPAQAIASKDCVTSECHGLIKSSKVIHGPVAADACDACHELTSAKAHTFALVREKEQLCTYCHEFRAKLLPVVHTPVARGECLGCHDPHGGNSAELMREASIAEACARCHESVTDDRAFVHSAVKQGACNSCHAPHAARFPKLLDVTGTDLCLTCHTHFKQQLAQAKFTHKALEQSCGKCHDAHGSAHPMATTQPVVEQCGGCHQKTIAVATHSVNQHSPMTQGQACLNCHTPHGGPFAKLMNNEQSRACLACHRQPLKDRSGRKLPPLTMFDDPSFKRHGAMKDAECSGCHAAHGADHDKLLAKNFGRRFYQSYSRARYELCFGCHDARLATLARAGKAITAFRDGERNLHFVHVNNGWKSHSCNACHASHGVPDSRRLVREVIPYGAWHMRMNFKQTSTGGSCAPGCHVPSAYDPEHPIAPTTLPASQPSSPAEMVLQIARIFPFDIEAAVADIPTTRPATRPTTRTTVGDGPRLQLARQIAAARRLLRERHPQQAYALLSEAAAQSPLPRDAQLDMVKALLELGEHEKAQRLFGTIPPGDVPSADQIVIEARLLVARGRWNEARANVLAGLEQVPDSADVHFLMGQIYEHESDWQRAASEYRAGYNCLSR